jgi:glycosyltransferase involved in cell wall biosynthesis
MSDPLATVLLPTTGNRSCLVEQAIWSLRRQTLGNWELFIVGDGVARASADRFREWCAGDARLRFVDRPKHARRGENYRHDVLCSQASGRFVAYLCDRDLFLPKHLEELATALESADFAHTLPVTVATDDRVHTPFTAAIWSPHERIRMGIPDGASHGLPLSTVGHSLAFYKTLPSGWSRTPDNAFTDAFMWRKFLENRSCRLASCLVPTVIYLPRGRHPGWPVEQRLAEMVRWRAKMEQPGFYEDYLEQVLRDVMERRIAHAARGWHELTADCCEAQALLLTHAGGPGILRARLLGFASRLLRRMGRWAQAIKPGG